MSLSEFKNCLESNGLNTCRILPQFVKFVSSGADTVATSISTTVSTAVPPGVLPTVSFPSTPSPFISSCDLPALKTFAKEEGFVLVKNVAKSASEGLGDLSKKTLDSVIESEAFSNFFEMVVDALPTGFIYSVLILGILVVILSLICYNSRQQAQMAAATIDALAEVVVVKNEPGIICFLFYILFYFVFRDVIEIFLFVLIFSSLSSCSRRECCSWCSKLSSPGWGVFLHWDQNSSWFFG